MIGLWNDRLWRKAAVHTQTASPPFKGAKIGTPIRDQICELIDTSAAELILRRSRTR
jgi:hypothetical protein